MQLSLVFLTILTAFLLICIIQSFLFYDISVNPGSSKNMNYTQQDLLDYEKDLSWLDQDIVKDIFIQSEDGLKLHGYYANNKNDTWAILCHGYTSSGNKMAYQAEHFYNMGYSVLMPDARGHGKSEGKYIGMGWDDRRDIVCWIKTILQKQPQAKIILYGISMGAATVLMTAGEPLPNNVKAIIEDCGYSSIRDEFTYILRHFIKLPSFPMLHAAAIHIKLRSGFNFLSEGNAVQQIKNAKTPILFIHGKQDTFVPYTMFQKLYNEAPEHKQCLIIDNAGHAESCIKEPVLYWQTITNFLKKHIRNS